MCDGADVTLRRACSRLDEVGCDLYALRGSAFCTWCKTGTTTRVPPPQRLFAQRSIAEKADRVVRIVSRVVDGVTIVRSPKPHAPAPSSEKHTMRMRSFADACACWCISVVRRLIRVGCRPLVSSQG